MTLLKLTSQWCNNFQLFNLGKLEILLACKTLSCDIGNYLIKRQSERYIIMIYFYPYKGAKHFPREIREYMAIIVCA